MAGDHLEKEDGDGNHLNLDKPQRGAEAKADAVKEEHANERLAEVIGASLATRGGEQLKSLRSLPSLVGKATGYDVAESHRNDTQGIEQGVDGKPPEMMNSPNTLGRRCPETNSHIRS